jgi:hypothetical protein
MTTKKTNFLGQLYSFAGTEWNYIPDAYWFYTEEGLSNGQLWRMNGQCQEVLREGIDFNKADLIKK